MSVAAPPTGRPRRRLVLVSGGVVLVSGVAAVTWFGLRGDELATLHGHTGPVRAIAIVADQNLVISAGDDGRIRFWDLRSNRSVDVFSAQEGGIAGVAVLPSRPSLVTVGPHLKPAVWSLPAGRPIQTVELPGAAESVAASPDGKHLAFGGSDGRIWRCSPPDHLTPKPFKGHGKGVHCLAFTTDGTRLFSASSDGFIRSWDAATGQLKDQVAIGNRKVHELARSPDGKHMVAAVAGVGLLGWAVDRREKPVAFGPDAGMSTCVAYSPDGSRLVSGHEDGAVKLWDADPARVVRTYRGHRLSILAVAFAPDGASVYSASGDGTIKRWGVPSRSP